MKSKFDANQTFRVQAISSAVDLFHGQCSARLAKSGGESDAAVPAEDDLTE